MNIVPLIGIDNDFYIAILLMIRKQLEIHISLSRGEVKLLICLSSACLILTISCDLY